MPGSEGGHSLVKSRALARLFRSKLACSFLRVSAGSRVIEIDVAGCGQPRNGKPRRKLQHCAQAQAHAHCHCQSKRGLSVSQRYVLTCSPGCTDLTCSSRHDFVAYPTKSC